MRNIVLNSNNEKILEITHKNHQSKEKIKEDLARILGEPPNDEEWMRHNLMTEIIYNGRWKSGGVAVSELPIIGAEIEKILQKQKDCCKLRESLFSRLAKRSEEATEVIILTHYIQITSTKFSLIAVNNEVCAICQELRESLTKFLQKRGRIAEEYEEDEEWK